METERQSPDAILELTNLTGLVLAIQDDPDSPDGSWLTATSNNADSVCRVSFPTPTGNPTVGADLQEFRVLVRKFGGTGTPTARVELWENGILVRVGADIDITADTVLNLAWDANELGTPDGSLVECRVYNTKAGGAPSKRATIEVGAVEWNVQYDVVGEEHSGSGSISGNGLVGGVVKKGGRGSAMKSAGGLLLAIGLAGILGIASIVGGGSQFAVGKKNVSASATISASGSIVASGEATVEAEEYSGIAAISGRSTLVGLGTKSAEGIGAISGAGTITAGEEAPIATATGTQVSREERGLLLISNPGAITFIGEKKPVFISKK